MFIDKELYKDALVQYKEWNQAEKAARYKRVGMLTPTQTWQQYAELVELAWYLNPQQSLTQRIKKLSTVETYYAKIRKLESWRKENVE